MTTPAIHLIPWDKSAADNGREALGSIESAIDSLSEALAAEEEDRLPLEERIAAWEHTETLLKEATRHAVDARGALNREIAAASREKGFAECRGCHRFRDPATMRAEPFSYGTHGDESVRYFCENYG